MNKTQAGVTGVDKKEDIIDFLCVTSRAPTADCAHSRRPRTID